MLDSRTWDFRQRESTFWKAYIQVKNEGDFISGEESKFFNVARQLAILLLLLLLLLLLFSG